MELQTMYPPQKDSPSTFLTGDITAADTLINVGNAGALPQTVPYPLTLGFDKNVTETVIVTAIGSGNNQLTVTRGSGALAWQNGTKCARVFTAADLKTIQDNITAVGTGVDNANDKIDAIPIIQVAGGTGTTITLDGVTETQGYSVTFIASANNGGVATSINGKPAYKPGGTTPPTLISGKAYTFWYDAGNGGCFFIKASAEGDAITDNVLATKTFSNDSDTGLTGTMPNNGAVTITPGATDKPIPAGYHNGSGKVAGDADLVSGNIRSGVNIFGVAGNSNVIDTSAGDALASHILSGKKAAVDGVMLTGSIPSKMAATYNPSVSNQTIAAGQYLAEAQTIAATTGTAAAADVVSGKTFNSANGIGVTGTLVLDSNPVGSAWEPTKTDPFCTGMFEKFYYTNGVLFATVTSGAAVGRVQRSTDDGLTWDSINVPSFLGTSIRAIISIDANTLVIGGGYGKIARSTDGGLTWGDLITNPFGTSSYNVNAFLYENGVLTAFGDVGKVCQSTDGGLTWGSFINLPTNSNISAVAYRNGTMIAVGGSATVHRSTDGGLTWTQILYPFGVGVTNAVADVVYSDSVLVIVGDSGKLARSTDDGLTWSQISHPFGTSSITCLASYGAIVIAGGSSGKIARSVNNGSSWSSLLTYHPFGTLSLWALCYLNGATWVAGGAQGTYTRSTDNGGTWGSTLITKLLGLKTINAISSYNGIVLAGGGSGAQIMRSIDDGLTWSTANIPFTTTVVNDFAWIDGVCVMVGASGKIARSTDGGLTWGSLITNPFGGTDIQAIANVNGVLIAVGAGGKIARSTDGGLTWGSLITNPFGSSYIIYDVENVNGIAIAVGQNGQIARSTDGGLTWGSLITNPFGTSYIWCISNVNGIAIAGGSSGKTSRSTDGGLTWSAIATIPSSYTPYKIVNVNGIAVAACSNGRLARSTTNGLTWVAVTVYPLDVSYAIYGLGHVNGVLLAGDEIGGICRSKGY